MRARAIGFTVISLASLGACAGEFTYSDTCAPEEASGATGLCQAGAGGSNGQGGRGGASGVGGAAPQGAPVLQLPPRRAGLRRSRAVDVTVGLQQPFDADLSVTVDGLPGYMSAEALVLPAGATSGVLVMRASEAAPLGVLSQVRVRATGGGQAAEAVLDAWVQGEPGTLDKDFGQNGLVVGTSVTDVTGIGASAAGELLVAGTRYSSASRVAISKYLISGDVDTAFGDDGVLLYAPRGSTFGSTDPATARAIDVQPDGRFVTSSIHQVLQNGAGGSPEVAGYRLLVARHLPSGSLDASFGDGGAVTLEDGKLSKSDGVYSPESTPPTFGAGHLALGAIQRSASTGELFFITPNAVSSQSYARAFRLSATGAPDLSFGQSGFAPFSPPACHPLSAALTAEGSIVLVGALETSPGKSQACVVRLNASGQLDPSFGQGGSKVVPLPPEAGVKEEGAVAVAVQPDGAIVVTGVSYRFNDTNQILLARLLPDGSFDSSFGDGGRTSRLPEAIQTDYSFQGVTVQLDIEGRVVVLVQEFVEYNAAKTFVVRYSKAGTLDGEFGTSGARRVSFKADEADDFGALANGFVQLPDGRIVVVGAFEGSQRLARLWP